MSEVAVKPDLDGLRSVVDAVRETWFWQFSMKQWCGTACCAIGNWCKQHPDDRLQMRKGEWSYVPWLGEIVGYSAVAERFGIERWQAAKLFSPECYQRNSRSAVIARIEQFVREHEAT